jgi:hypothetical protein
MNTSTSEQTLPAPRLANEPGSDDPAEARRGMLKQLAERLDQHHAFAEGQFVAWKPGLKNRTYSDYGEPSGPNREAEGMSLRQRAQLP